MADENDALRAEAIKRLYASGGDRWAATQALIDSLRDAEPLTATLLGAAYDMRLRAPATRTSASDEGRKAENGRS